MSVIEKVEGGIGLGAGVTLTPEQEALRTLTHQLAESMLRPISLQLDTMTPEAVIAPDSPLWGCFKTWFSLGSQSLSMDDSSPADPLTFHLLAVELGWGAADLGISLGVSSMPFMAAARSVARTGNERVRDEIVKPFQETTEPTHIGCWAITEPDHGSDTLAVSTPEFREAATAGSCRARQVGGDWVISGQKAPWVSNGTIATHALLFCNIEPSKGSAGGGVIIVPLDLPGVSKGAPLDKIGQRALNQGEIFFDDVHVPGDYLLAGPEDYSETLTATLAEANTGMGAIFAGLARAAFEEAWEYARTRVQGGRRIIEHQLVEGKLFEMFMRAEQARALSAATAVRNGGGRAPSLPHAIASKVTSTKAAFDVASDAIQVFGGMGLAKGSLIEKFFRDARASMIEDGVNELLALVGARELLAAEEGSPNGG